MTTSMKAQSPPELDYSMLDRLFDRTKTKVFLGRNAAFLGPLMCSMNFSWTEDIETACTNGITLWWNPHFYLAMEPEVRETILLHELWHPALLHHLRRGERNSQIWNWAADIVINNMLDDEGYSFGTFKPWMDHQFDGCTTEEVYDALYQRQQDELAAMFGNFQWVNPFSGQGDPSDMEGPPGSSSGDDASIGNIILNNVVAASHSANMSGCGNVPGETEVMLKRFLAPKLPWEQILFNFFNELAQQDYSWARPNRRFQDLYLPGLVDDEGGLAHLMYFLDVSGSISDGDLIRFHSEFKYVKEHFEPEKMTMVQFDTKIQKEDVFLKEDPFEETKIKGRGGTSLVCVREHILEHRPTAVVVFSDLDCPPMEALPPNLNIPIIWIGLNAGKTKVNQGTLVHLRE